MALSNASTLSSKTLCNTRSLCPSSENHQPTFFIVPSKKTNHGRRAVKPISAVHAAEPSKKAVVSSKPAAAAPSAGKWSLESWKSKPALQLPEYPNKEEFESVLKTIENFPPIVFAGEARSLEERLGEAAMGNAFLLQGGDCAESFKEFSANYIRDTFRVLLQMSVVLMFGGQVPVIKVGQF